MEWSSECREVRDELLIKVTESDEGPDCFYQSRRLSLFHSLEFSGVHMYFPVLDYQSQVLHLDLVKSTFGQLEVEVFFLHPFEYSLSPFLAFLKSLGKYEDIVHVNDEPSFHNHVSEGGVHEGLEGWQGVALSKEHD